MLIATDRPGLGAGLSLYLGQHDVDVVGVVSHLGDVVGSAAATRADAVLADVRIGDGLGEVARELKRLPHAIAVVILRADDEPAVPTAAAADAVAAVGDPPKTLLELLDTVRPAPG